jgi:hypothetical protein
MPPNVRAESVEVAESPETTADGNFVFDNLAGGDLLRPTDTDWLSGVPVAPGTYYVHLRGYDSSCTTTSRASPCGPAWSNILSFSTPRTPLRVSPGSRSCRLAAGE